MTRLCAHVPISRGDAKLRNGQTLYRRTLRDLLLPRCSTHRQTYSFFCFRPVIVMLLLGTIVCLVTSLPASMNLPLVDPGKPIQYPLRLFSTFRPRQNLHCRNIDATRREIAKIYYRWTTTNPLSP